MRRLPFRFLLLVPLAAAAPWPVAASDPWPMFHHDERHTGFAAGAGAIPPAGPTRRWEIQIAPGAASEEADATYRWYSGFPLADLDGNGILDVVVTSRDLGTPEANEPGNPSGTVWAIRTSGPGSAAPLWAPFEGSPTQGAWGARTGSTSTRPPPSTATPTRARTSSSPPRGGRCAR